MAAEEKDAERVVDSPMKAAKNVENESDPCPEL